MLAAAEAPGGRHRASPIHRRRARAASFITAYPSKHSPANPPNNVSRARSAATLAASKDTLASGV